MTPQQAAMCQPRDWAEKHHRLALDLGRSTAGLMHALHADQLTACADVIEYQARVIEHLRAELRGSEMTLDGANLA